jgi:hypothetical protein
LTIAGTSLTVTQSAAGACTYTVTPTSQSLSSAASSNNIETITTAAGCSWTASDNASWITITSGSSGSGNGTTSFSATSNTALTARTATLTIAGQAVTVIQAGVCTYTVGPTAVNAEAADGTQSASITAGGSCAWTSVSNASWITITAGASGTGNGATTYRVAANSTPGTRTGTLTVAGRTVTVTQAAGGTGLVAPGNLRIIP